MKMRKVDYRHAPLNQGLTVGKNWGACESSGTPNVNLTPEPMNTRHLPGGKDPNAMVDSNDPAASGLLDDFLNANGPLSVTIEAALPSPDKTTSEMSGITSPDLVSVFPFSERYRKDFPLHSSADIAEKSEFGNSTCSEPKTFFWIKIESAEEQNSSPFSIPLPMMLQRELEMQSAARASNIAKDRWSSSRIFRMWKAQYARQQKSQEPYIDNGAQENKISNSPHREEIFLRMTPEMSMQNSNSSCRSFRWKPWLTTCIRSYYDTGRLRISNDCTGDDILLALEYFGILTSSPDDFIFDSDHAYARIQAWSRYFTHRAHLAESLLEANDADEAEAIDLHDVQLKSGSDIQRNIVWVLFREKEKVLEDQCQYDIVEDFPKADSQSSLHSPRIIVRKLTVQETGGLFDLFSGSKVEERFINSKLTMGEEFDRGKVVNTLSQEMPSRMRQDFCDHLKNFLPPWKLVRFDIEPIDVRPISTAESDKCREPSIEYRPVIRFYENQSYPATTMPKKKGNNSILHRLESAKSNGDPIALNQPSCHEPNSPCRYEGNAPSFSDSDENRSSPNGNKWSGVERTENDNRNHDYESKQSFNTVDEVSKLNLNQTENYYEDMQISKPITFINMELGDLRSVTSVLSEPVIDIPRGLRETRITRNAGKHRIDKKDYQGELPVLLTAKKIVEERTERENQKCVFIEPGRSKRPPPSPNRLKLLRLDFDANIATPPRTTRNVRNTPPWDIGRKCRMVEKNKDFTDKKKCRSVAVKRNEKVIAKGISNEAKVTMESDISEYDDENSDAKSGTGSEDFHGTWGQFLASVCEVMIPAPSTNILSSSPIRHFTASSSKSTSSTAASSDDEHQTCRAKHSSDALTDGIVDQAKRMGKDLSNQFDELMRLAYNEKGNAPDGLQSLSPISEEIPETLSIDSDENQTLTSCLTSSIVGQPRNTRTPGKLKASRKTDHKSLSVENSSDMVYAIPKSKSFELDPFSKATVSLPHRIGNRNSRRLTREKQALARKKATLRDLSERNALPRTKGKTGPKDNTRKLSPAGSADDYRKENRYSPHENRFYS